MNLTKSLVCLVGVFGSMACSSADGGADKVESPLSLDGEELHAEIYVLNHNETASPGHTAGANFAVGRWYGPGRKCTEESEGSCKVSHCESVPLEPPPHPPVFVSAGTISFSGANIPPNSTVSPNKDNNYSYWYGPEVIWTGGEDVHISVQGDPQGIPAFDANVKAPSLIRVDKPNWDDRGRDGLVIDRSKGLELAWRAEGAPSSNVKLHLVASEQNPQSGPWDELDCNFPVSQGEATVPASTLGKLRASDFGAIEIDTGERQTIEAGAWKVNVNLRTNGTLQNGRISEGPAKFE